MKRHLIATILAIGGLAIAPLADAGRESVPPAQPEQAPAGNSELKDAFIKTKIVSAFAANPHVSALDLDVRVDNGIAYLTGAVDNKTERDLAIEIARGIDEVRKVESAITLKSTAAASAKTEKKRTVGQTVDDATITASVKGKLLRNESTPGGQINVTTVRGVVTLTGTVENDAQKDLAGRIAENTANVAGVNNQLTVARN